jgi:hypothetical protein
VIKENSSRANSAQKCTLINVSRSFPLPVSVPAPEMPHLYQFTIAVRAYKSSQDPRVRFSIGLLPAGAAYMERKDIL